MVELTDPAAPGHGIPLRWNAVVLAGGRATRLGGVAKPLVEVRGRTMLDAALAAASEAQRVVVVGEVPVPPGVLRTVEDPPHGGPAAGLAAGLAALDVDAPWVLVLASDLPGAEEAVPVLLAAAGDGPPVDGVCFHDGESHPQWMLAIYRSVALQKAVAQVETRNLSLRRLLAPLSLQSIPGEPAALRDCDTWEDVSAANAMAISPTPHERENR
ncbi:MAG: molybdenum cofactor guanylyltransferase [Dermatophilaceae bacterium]|nr:NTP transferase domain-containing protein [Intrasporangiaceae bacterium]